MSTSTNQTLSGIRSKRIAFLKKAKPATEGIAVSGTYQSPTSPASNDPRAGISGLPPHFLEFPTVPAVGEDSVNEIIAWYQESQEHLNYAKDILQQTAPTSGEIDWKVTLYQLIIAYIVNFRYDEDAIAAEEAAIAGDNEKSSRLIDKSERYIDRAAEVFGLKYTGIVDLCTIPRESGALKPKESGPFCGIFSSAGDKPFMILSFKGTTNQLELNTDIKIGPAKANPITILDGKEVHSGMQHGLFTAWPDFDPAFNIIWDDLEHVARTILGRDESAPVPLYISGHSLGAGYATLAFTELSRRLALSDTTARAYNLKGLWTFGSPRVGLNDFASDLRTALSTSGRVGFRLANQRDVVPFVPAVWLGNSFIHLDNGFILHRNAAGADGKYFTPDPTEIGGAPKQDTAGDAYWDFHFPPEYYASIKTILGDQVDTPFPNPGTETPEA